jgi:hypothetical protein
MEEGSEPGGDWKEKRVLEEAEDHQKEMTRKRGSEEGPGRGRGRAGQGEASTASLVGLGVGTYANSVPSGQFLNSG